MEAGIAHKITRDEEHTLLLIHRLDITRKLVQLCLKTGKKKIINDYLRIFEGTVNNLLDWRNIYPVINSLHYGFGEKLKRHFPILTEQQFRLCCLLRAGFRSEEISILLNYENLNSVHVVKNRVYKVMGFPRYKDFVEFLMNF